MNILTDISYRDFADGILTNNKQIICYGAGMVAQAIEHIFDDSGILSHICCFVDSDEKKHGDTVNLGHERIVIHSPEMLSEKDLSDKVLLITCEAFTEIIKTLSGRNELNDLPCYIFPELNRSYAKEKVDNDLFCAGGYKEKNCLTQIPKTIHYCWFGGKEMSPFLRDCVSTWHQHNLEYEIVCWNEDNYDVYKNKYIKQAYQNGKFAFATDFARLDILYQYGGIYLDTDVAVLKNLDELLYNKAFISYDQWPMPNSAVSGSVAGLEIIKELRDDPRGSIEFIDSDGASKLTTNSVYEASVLQRYGFRKNFSYQIIKDLAVYPPCFFSSQGQTSMNIDSDERTYAIHYCRRSWSEQTVNISGG